MSRLGPPGVSSKGSRSPDEEYEDLRSALGDAEVDEIINSHYAKLQRLVDNPLQLDAEKTLKEILELRNDEILLYTMIAKKKGQSEETIASNVDKLERIISTRMENLLAATKRLKKKEADLLFQKTEVEKLKRHIREQQEEKKLLQEEIDRWEGTGTFHIRNAGVHMTTLTEFQQKLRTFERAAAEADEYKNLRTSFTEDVSRALRQAEIDHIQKSQTTTNTTSLPIRAVYQVIANRAEELGLRSYKGQSFKPRSMLAPIGDEYKMQSSKRTGRGSLAGSTGTYLFGPNGKEGARKICISNDKKLSEVTIIAQHSVMVDAILKRKSAVVTHRDLYKEQKERVKPKQPAHFELIEEGTDEIILPKTYLSADASDITYDIYHPAGLIVIKNRAGEVCGLLVVACCAIRLKDVEAFAEAASFLVQEYHEKSTNSTRASSEEKTLRLMVQGSLIITDAIANLRLKPHESIFERIGELSAVRIHPFTSVGMIDIDNSTVLENKIGSANFAKVLLIFYNFVGKFMQESAFAGIIGISIAADASLYAPDDPRKLSNHAAIVVYFALRFIKDRLPNLNRYLRDKMNLNVEIGVHGSIATGQAVQLFATPEKHTVISTLLGATPNEVSALEKIKLDTGPNVYISEKTWNELNRLQLIKRGKHDQLYMIWVSGKNVNIIARCFDFIDNYIISNDGGQERKITFYVLQPMSVPISELLNLPSVNKPKLLSFSRYAGMNSTPMEKIESRDERSNEHPTRKIKSKKSKGKETDDGSASRARPSSSTEGSESKKGPSKSHLGGDSPREFTKNVASDSGADGKGRFPPIPATKS